MEVISINQLRVALGKTALQHKFVNDFFWGDIDSMRAWKERIAQYPLVTAYTTGLQVNKTTKIITLNIEVSDKMYKDWNINLNEIESDTPEILEDIFNALRNMPEWRNVLTVQSDSFTASKFINQTGDVIAGWRASINLKLIRQQGLCLAPFEDIEPTPPFVCADGTVNITNSDNDLLGSVVVPSGGVGTFVVIVKNTSGDVVPTTIVNGELIVDCGGQSQILFENGLFENGLFE